MNRRQRRAAKVDNPMVGSAVARQEVRMTPGAIKAEYDKVCGWLDANPGLPRQFKIRATP